LSATALQLGSLVVLVPAMVALVRFPNFVRSVQWVAFLLIGYGLNEFVSVILSFTVGNNSMQYFIFTIFMLVCMVGYATAALGKPWIKYLLLLGMAPVVEYALDRSVFNSYSFAIVDVVCIYLSLAIFKAINDTRNYKLLWVNAGVLFLLLNNFMFYSMIKLLHPAQLDLLYDMALILVIGNMLVGVYFTFVLWSQHISYT